LDELATFSILGHPAWAPEAINADNIEAPTIGKILFMGDFPLSLVSVRTRGGCDQ
jgi:hypothetical protein